jgi:hypothetical protein
MIFFYLFFRLNVCCLSTTNQGARIADIIRERARPDSSELPLPTAAAAVRPPVGGGEISSPSAPPSRRRPTGVKLRFSTFDFSAMDYPDEAPGTQCALETATLALAEALTLHGVCVCVCVCVCHALTSLSLSLSLSLSPPPPPPPSPIFLLLILLSFTSSFFFLLYT